MTRADGEDMECSEENEIRNDSDLDFFDDETLF